jgi:phage terminase small subunit
MSTPTPPAHLSAEAQGLWTALQEAYDLADDLGKLLLRTALEAFDRAQGARSAIERDGPTVSDARGAMRAHPLIAVERDARAAMVSALKALRIDVIPTRPGPGRPPGSTF